MVHLMARADPEFNEDGEKFQNVDVRVGSRGILVLYGSLLLCVKLLVRSLWYYFYCDST